MKYLGLDLGTKTLGIALSDLTHTIATAYGTIRFEENNYDNVINNIKKIVIENKVSKIILGLPKNMNNTIGDRCQSTLEFKSKLEKEIGIEVIMQDERLTTVEATHYMLEADLSRKKRKKKIDGLAANIILQTYLDKEKGEKNARRKDDI